MVDMMERSSTGTSAEVAPDAYAGVAVLVPCYNEAASVQEVVRGFQEALPGCVVYVYDNNSKDGTAALAAAAGAVVRVERRQGKGHVVRRMFSDVEADIYLMVDGDATYHAPSAPALIRELLDGPHDIVNGARVATSKAAYRLGHTFGNKMLTNLVRMFFGAGSGDMLSGYKAMSRRFVKSFPVTSRGFEIETELLIHALELRTAMSEIPTPYAERGEGSTSKLRTYSDGFRILRLIALLVKDERPLQFFSGVAAFLALISIVLGVPLVIEYFETGLVPRLPTAILATGVMVMALLSVVCGLILDTLVRARREAKHLAYLAIPSVRLRNLDR